MKTCGRAAARTLARPPSQLVRTRPARTQQEQTRGEGGKRIPDHAIIERDVRCVRCGETLNLQVHHRKLRSAGTDDRPSNLITLCWRCHDWVHKHPRLSRIHGWLVSAYADPAAVPVRHFAQDGFVLLDDDYGFRPWPSMEESND